MKAKEYYRKYRHENIGKTSEERVWIALCEMFNEVDQIQKLKKSTNDATMKFIFNQQNQKANAFINRVNERRVMRYGQDLFKFFVKHESPRLALSLNWL